MWKSRKELPNLKLLDIEFDIDKLLHDYNIVKTKPWNAYDCEFIDLNKKWSKISEKSDWKNQKTQQMALTVFNTEYKIRENRESGSKWDTSFMKGDKRFDERAYNKIKDDLPPYLNEVLNCFQPEISRTILSNIKANCAVPKHMDHDSLLSVRYHIALETNPNCYLCYEQNNEIVKVHIPVDGRVWFLNPGLPHWAENNGDTDRIHLIINMDSQRMIQ